LVIPQDQRAVVGEFAIRDAIEVQTNPARVGAWRDDEIVFELPASAVEDKVDPWIHVAILNLRVGMNICAPLAGISSREIVARAGQRLEPCDLLRQARSARNLHPYHRS